MGKQNSEVPWWSGNESDADPRVVRSNPGLYACVPGQNTNCPCLLESPKRSKRPHSDYINVTHSLISWRHWL